MSGRTRRTRVSRIDTRYPGVVTPEDNATNAANSSTTATTTTAAIASNSTNTNATSDTDTELDSPKPLAEVSVGEETDSSYPYHKPLANTAPIGPHQASARAR